MISDDQINDAADAAVGAFFASLQSVFHLDSGDLSPADVDAFDRAARSAASAWVRTNAPTHHVPADYVVCDGAAYAFVLGGVVCAAEHPDGGWDWENAAMWDNRVTTGPDYLTISRALRALEN